MSDYNENKKWRKQILNILMLIGFGYILIRASIELSEIAWGSGIWLGEFSLKWGIGFFAFVGFCILCWIAAARILWRQNTLAKWGDHIISIRKKLGIYRWLAAIALLVFPIWYLQYTPWGIVFSGFYFRLFLWVYMTLGLAIILQSGKLLLNLSTFLVALLLTSSAFSTAFAFVNVIDYPFSLGWSEGNRMWDYSMMFGRNLYDISPDKEVFVLLDVGRQFIGGLPFLLPNVTIQMERFWIALTGILPYLLLGLAAFRREFKNKKTWLLLGIWTFIFLKQGPIHPPLVICALAVALVWRNPLWVGIPLIIATGYFAEESRFTWLFAPGIWIVMLEFAGAELENGRIPKSTWLRAGILGLAGAFGGYYAPKLVAWFLYNMSSGVSVAGILGSFSAQPLLWYRLFPNATYGTGILIALFIAVGPLSIILLYLLRSKHWILDNWQKWSLTLPLMAFLVVGLIVSTKVGGGGDLHNLDMSMIGLLFIAVVAWQKGGRDWFFQVNSSPLWTKMMLTLLLVLPGLYPLSQLQLFQYSEDTFWILTLTGKADEKSLELLPAQNEVDNLLQTIRQEVKANNQQGEILFIDQRQLLTFRYVQNVTLIPEYEKKVLMNEAMSGSEKYFKDFYQDLANHRFSLIISEPLRAPIKDSNYQFGEESNAWVKWVVQPVLCYYEPIATNRNVQVQLLIPTLENAGDCVSQ